MKSQRDSARVPILPEPAMDAGKRRVEGAGPALIVSLFEAFCVVGTQARWLRVHVIVKLTISLPAENHRSVKIQSVFVFH